MERITKSSVTTGLSAVTIMKSGEERGCFAADSIIQRLLYKMAKLSRFRSLLLEIMYIVALRMKSKSQRSVFIYVDHNTVIHGSGHKTQGKYYTT